MPRVVLSTPVFRGLLPAPDCNALGQIGRQMTWDIGSNQCRVPVRKPFIRSRVADKRRCPGGRGSAVTIYASAPFALTVVLTPPLLGVHVLVTAFLTRPLVGVQLAVTVFLARPLLGVQIAPVPIHVA